MRFIFLSVGTKVPFGHDRRTAPTLVHSDARSAMIAAASLLECGRVLNPFHHVSTRRAWLPLATCLAIVFFGTSARSVYAQEADKPAEPRLHQPGKDVQWVPTPLALVEKMLDLAELTPKDRLVDLGSGDGVLVIAAAHRGARARGIEYDRGLVAYAKRKAEEAGVSRLTTFDRADIFKSDFSGATVVTTFLLPSMNLRLRPTFLAMKPGTRIVANTFSIAEWEPDATASIEPCERWCTALLWIVPARVAGTWTTPRGDLTLIQKFQKISGTLGKQTIEDGRLRGDAITFAAGGTAYLGRVDGTRMRLTATTVGGSSTFTATAQPMIRR